MQAVRQVSLRGRRFLIDRDDAAARAGRRAGPDCPACRPLVIDTGQGLHGPTRTAVGQVLDAQPGLVAVYSVGGANLAILEAFDRAGWPCRMCIGHDLDDDDLALLRGVRLSAMLHRDLHHDLHTAWLLLMQAHGAAGAVLMRSNVELTSSPS